MKAFFPFFFLLLSFNLFAAPKMEKVPIVFVETEIKDRQVELLIEGYLPNSCFAAPRAETYPGKGIYMVDVVSRVKGEQCAEVARFFEIKARLGTYNPGVHSVVLQEGSRWEREIVFEVDRSKALPEL